jgi:hypothetical protein
MARRVAVMFSEAELLAMAERWGPEFKAELETFLDEIQHERETAYQDEPDEPAPPKRIP